MARVAVIGGSISGLGTALMLGRRGHTVTLFEQDARQAEEDLDRDFFHWDRPRVPQAGHPHSLLAPVRTVLRAEAPDVYTDVLARGAREYHEFDWRPAASPTPLPVLFGPGRRVAVGEGQPGAGVVPSVPTGR